METAASFRLRRVLLGVVVGLTLLALGFYGWARFRSAEYHRREAGVLQHYRSTYRFCLQGGVPASACLASSSAACAADPFWSVTEPFSVDLRQGSAEAQDRCGPALAR